MTTEKQNLAKYLSDVQSQAIEVESQLKGLHLFFTTDPTHMQMEADEWQGIGAIVKNIMEGAVGIASALDIVNIPKATSE